MYGSHPFPKFFELTYARNHTKLTYGRINLCGESLYTNYDQCLLNVFSSFFCAAHAALIESHWHRYACLLNAVCSSAVRCLYVAGLASVLSKRNGLSDRNVLLHGYCCSFGQGCPSVQLCAYIASPKFRKRKCSLLSGIYIIVQNRFMRQGINKEMK